MSKLSKQQIEEIKDKYMSGESSHRELAEEYNVSRSTINRIVNPSYAAKERESNRVRIRNNRNNYQVKRYTSLTFHLEKDADVIKKLDSVDNRQGYIRDLIRKDIAEN